MMNYENYYQHHLNQVSRSFALSIAHLHEPLRSYVALSYLLCRVLDTIEDTAWVERSMQIRSFVTFDALLQGEQLCIDDFIQSFPGNIPDHEMNLIRDCAPLFKDFKSLPEDVKSCLLDPILSMSRGMLYFSQEDGRQAGLTLRTQNEVNQYCFFVAGVVGEILNNLIQLTMKSDEINNVDLVDAFHFALFLQKINILKDQEEDRKQGRFLIPHEQEFFKSFRSHIQKAFNYILQLPERMKDYRLFCSWSFFLGLQTINNVMAKRHNKLTSILDRKQAVAFFDFLKEIADSNDQLEKIYSEIRVKIEECLADQNLVDEIKNTSATAVISQVMNLYQGKLSRKKWAELGIF